MTSKLLAQSPLSPVASKVVPSLRRRHGVILRWAIEFHHGFVFQIIGDACYADVCLSLVHSQYQFKPICYEMRQLLSRKSI